MRSTSPVILLVLLAAALVSADRSRPFYVIGHMVNSLRSLDVFIADGANAIESDVTFNPDGSIWGLHHGVPCDFARYCHESADFRQFLQAAAPRNLALFFVDLKVRALNQAGLVNAGRQVAKHIVEHFWNRGASNTSVLVSVPRTSHAALLEAFLDEIRKRAPHQEKKVTFEVSENPNFQDLSNMLRGLNITATWLGDGITNWLEPMRDFSRIIRAIRIRNSQSHVIRKVYRWTVDNVARTRFLLSLGIDGVITNKPYWITKLIQHTGGYRLATPNDSVNEVFIP